MTINIPAYKYIQNEQNINFLNGNICTLIGENGSGKSTILESIFNKYIEEDDKKVICFTSGQNELFYSIFNKHKQQSNKFKPDENNIINSFYFDYWWVRFLVFFAVTIKRNGKVKQYFDEKNYDLSSLSIDFKFRVRKPYINQIKNELQRESSGEFAIESKRRTIHYNLLLKLINEKINADYDFDEIDNNIVKRTISLNITEARNILGNEANKVFTFLSHSTMGWLSNIEIESCGLYLQQNSRELEFEQLSDGEYQLLSIYALIDLFDSENTIFLFDEIDSHLHFSNINKLWNILKTISGKVITTTHISESILKNNYDSLHCINNGKIEDSLTATEVFKRLSNITGQKKYEYKIASKIKNIALLDDEVDWKIFKKLAVKKISSEVSQVLDKITPYKRTSSFNTTGEIFGKGKLEFVKEFKEQNNGNIIETKNIFLICDRDILPLTQINHQDLSVNIDATYNSFRMFGTTKIYLHSWRMLEIENYLLSKTMLQHYGKLEEITRNLPSVNFDSITIFDESEDLRTYDAKTILHPLYKANGFDEVKLDEIIDRIPSNEISEDIVKMYEFIKSKVESN